MEEENWIYYTNTSFGKQFRGTSDFEDWQYDASGNMTANWESQEEYYWNGPQLSGYNTGHDEYYGYSYNADGIRTDKALDYYGEIIESVHYTLDGDLILAETHYGTNGDFVRRIMYYYDESGSPVGLSWNGNDYYYYKNIFGDILGIMNSSGTMVVRYTYDAWGRILSTTGDLASTLGRYNPFRYRSYYYDRETGLYYLQARYYDPTIGRFISPDPVLDTTRAIGCNMYAYCGNDPINKIDQSGAFPWVLAGVIAVGVIVGGILGGFSSEKLWDLSDEDTGPEIPATELPDTIKPKEPVKDKLTVWDRVANVAIGAGLGAAVTGGVIAVVGAGATMFVGTAVVLPVVGVTGAQMFAIGALAYNAFAIFIAPFLGIEAEPIEP